VNETRAKTREDAKRETREALIRAGMSLFSEEGIDLPSLDAICARAGFTRGAFYVHFKDRDDFLEAVINRVFGEFVNTVIAGGETGDDLRETVDRFVALAARGAVPLLGQRRLVMQLMGRGVQRAENMRARFKGLLEYAIQRLSKATETGQRAGRVGTDAEAELVATWLVAAALGMITLLDVGLEMDEDRIRKSARDLLQLRED